MNTELVRQSRRQHALGVKVQPSMDLKDHNLTHDAKKVLLDNDGWFTPWNVDSKQRMFHTYPLYTTSFSKLNAFSNLITRVVAWQKLW